MTTITQDIHGAIETQAATAAGYPPADRRAFVGVPFTPPNAQSWVRVSHLPGPTRPRNVYGDRAHSGIAQFDFYTPANGGAGAAKALADALAAVFRTGLDRPRLGAAVVNILYAEHRMYDEDARWTRATIDVGWSARP